LFIYISLFPFIYIYLLSPPLKTCPSHSILFFFCGKRGRPAKCWSRADSPQFLMAKPDLLPIWKRVECQNNFFSEMFQLSKSFERDPEKVAASNSGPRVSEGVGRP
jgi:hypothetical protein